jgi:TolB protein
VPEYDRGVNLRWLVGGLALSLVALTALGLRTDRPMAAAAPSVPHPPKVWGGITYVCQVRYLDGTFPELCYLRLAPNEPDNLTFDKAPKRDPAWSPDGTRIAYVRGVPGKGEIYSWNYSREAQCGDGCRAHGPSRHLASGEQPAWSPNGAQIAFASTRGGNSDIFVVRERGGTVRRLTTGSTDDTDPAWSPNGRTIAYTRASTIRLVNVDGSGDRALGAGNNAAWAPNGRRLAFELGDEIWLSNANGTARARLASAPGVEMSSPTWSADGSAVAFAGRATDGTHAMYIRHLAGPLQRIVLSGDFERPFAHASVDWQHVRVLVATVSERGPVVSFRDARGQRLKTIRAGTYAFAYVDRSKRHGIRFSFGRVSDITVRWVGRQWPRPQQGGYALLRPGVYTYWCPAHPRERGRFRVIEQA